MLGVAGVAGGQMVDAAPSSGARVIRGDIEGLRAVAVLAVVLFHAGVPGLGGGYVGVDVFFVISGFLITSHLAEGLPRSGRVGFGQFYARRIRRILPASVLVIGATLLASLVVLPVLQIEAVVREAAAAVAYVPNLLFAARGTEYLADPTPSPYQHYWSLGVEEQFYLVWPIALLVIWKVAGGRRGVATALLAGAVVASFGLCMVMMERSQPYAFFLLPSRAWELGVGGVLGLAAIGRVRDRLGPVRTVGAWIGIAMVAAAVVTFDDATRFPGPAAALPVLGTALVIWAGTAASRFAPAGLLSIRPAQFLGRLSYSIYLWHWPLLVLGAAAVGHELALPLRLGLAATSVPLALVSYHLVEQPVRTSRRWSARPGLTIGVAVAATVALIGATFGVGYVWETKPLYAGADVATQPLGEPPAFTAVVPHNLTPSLRDAEDDLPVVYADGCHLEWSDTEPRACESGVRDSDRTVVLFGDSHAAQWFPAVERYAIDNSLRLVSHTKRSCPSADMPKDNLGNPFTACDTWRHRVFDLLAAGPPDLVIIANARGHRPSAAVDPVEAWNEGLRRTLDALPATSEVVVVADTPQFSETPSLCLSAHLDDTAACAVARTVALDDAWTQVEEQTVREHGDAYVDLNRYLCDDGCGPVIGPYLVYRDRNHLTTSMAVALAPCLAEDLTAAGITWPSP